MISQWVLLAALSAILFGLGDFVVVYSEQAKMNVVTLYITYTIIIGLLNALFLLFFKRTSFQQIISFTPKEWSIVGALCVFYLFAYLLHFIAIQQATNPGYANALVMFHVAILSTLSWMYLKKPLNAMALSGVAAMFVGAILISVYS